MPEPSELTNADINPGHIEPLDYPFVKIPEKYNTERSANYFIAESIIEEGIANSTVKGLSVYMVKVRLPATSMYAAEEGEVSLGQYLAGGGLSRSVSSEELKALLDEYNPLNEAYQERHKNEAGVPFVDTATQKKIGTTATASTNLGLFKSGGRSYKDFASAAANDSED
jgi:hypothetical protein